MDILSLEYQVQNDWWDRSDIELPSSHLISVWRPKEANNTREQGTFDIALYQNREARSAMELFDRLDILSAQCILHELLEKYNHRR